MLILYSSLHNLDMNRDNPIRKEIPEDFNSYVDAYIKFATTENDSSREYNPIDANRTVLRCVSTIFSDVLHQGDVVTDTCRVNEADIGPLGLGGNTSVLATFLKVGPQRASGVRIVCVRPTCCFEPRIATVEL